MELKTMKIKKIKDIFEITRGFSFKQAVKHNSLGDVFVVQAGNIKESMDIDHEEMIKIKSSEVQTKAIVREGDVILSSRGNLRAGIADERLDKAIASASTFILRVVDKEVLPEYVAAYFNSQLGQADLKRASLSISITALSTTALMELKIPLPDIDGQELFVKMYKNKVKQKELLVKKIEIVEEALEGAIKKIIK